MLAPGVELDDGAEVGVGGGIGIKTRLGRNAFVGPCCVIEHGVHIGDDSVVGAHSYVGSGSRVANDIRLPACTTLSPRTRVTAKEVRAQSSQTLARELFANEAMEFNA